MNHQKLAEYLEILCQSGCDAVNATIKAMENGQSISLSEELTTDEHHIILKELKAIMSVYEH